MNKRLGFAIVLSASALVWIGCDGEDTTPDGGPICGGDTGIICPTDAGEEVPDSGPEPDAGSGPTMCQTTAGPGGRCRGGLSCNSGLTCFPDLVAEVGPITLADFPGWPTAVEDPENPGQYIVEPGLPDVELTFAPGGQCSTACNPQADTCAGCSVCSTSVGGSPFFAAIGFGPRSFDLTDANPSTSEREPLTSEANPGICRASCEFDPNSRGCQAGYSCDPAENVCLEECVSDAQCNLGIAESRHEGIVVLTEGSATCNRMTGRCEWEPPAGAALGSACEASTDCPEHVGTCLIGGVCATTRCNTTALGDAATPCTEGICGIGSETDPGTCYKTCEDADECGIPGVACTNAIWSNPASAPKICIGICAADTDCMTGESCRVGGFTDQPTWGRCQATCDPAGDDCGANERCVQAAGQTYGFCEATNALCLTDGACLEGQACEVLGNDALGQCVDGCTEDADCATGEECRIQGGGQSCTENDDCNSGVCTDGTCAPSTVGICRAAGGQCSVPEDPAFAPLRGSAQCIESQECTGAADVVVTCTDRPVTPEPDAGTGDADAGVDGGA